MEKVISVIELSNNHFLKMVYDITSLPIDAIDIQNLKLGNIRKKHTI